LSINTDPAYGDLLLHQWFKTYRQDVPDKDKLIRMYDLLVRIIIEVTDTSGLQFHTLFTRIAYLGTVRKLPPGVLFNLHLIRRDIFHWYSETEISIITNRIDMVARAGSDLIVSVYECKLPAIFLSHLPEKSVYHQPEYRHEGHIDHARVEVVAIDSEKKQITVVAEDSDGSITVLYDVTGKNDQFSNAIPILQKHNTLPVSVSLIDIEVNEKGHWIPMAIVILPDYLVDVTAVAESLKPGGVETLSWMLRKYLPMSAGIPLLIGNIVNYFLDELAADPTKTFGDLKKELFKLAPLSFATMSDPDLKKLLQELQQHYITLYRLVNGGFQKQGIIPESSVLEPTFYSEKFGLQGRLDMFFYDKENSAIVELKSGKPFMQNKYGLNQSHYLQTLLYDLLIQSVFDRKLKPTAYILYSRDQDKPLRFAPVVKAQQYEALAARNELIGVEMQLGELTDGSDIKNNILTSISVSDHPGLFGFMLSDVMEFERTYRSMTDLEKHYFLSFSGMVAREHFLAKIGAAGSEGHEGQAALWQKAALQKEQSFELLGKLMLEENKSGEHDPIVTLRRTKLTHPMANFRSGDIVVLYPEEENLLRPTKDQLLKCSIIEIDAHRVAVRLRARQTNPQHFDKHKYWNLEQDHLDSSFLGLTRGLYEWASAPPHKRELLLGLRPPATFEPSKLSLPADLTEEQAEICSNILQAPDYFLLWGPPGTGKTSKMLHHVVRYLLENTRERILLMAYTNRAVDEICSAILEISEEVGQQYIRIGSRYGAEPAFRPRLLDNLAAGCATRQELLDLLASQRIVTGTLASLQGKPELFNLLEFDRLIVDEASQILEPSMIGMMVRFDKVLLIGDHRQLPAVVAQDPTQTKINHEGLREIGLMDMRDSLFERLFNQARKKGWTHAYARLSHQGRMHEDIMDFPNRFFYEKGLKILPLNPEDHFQSGKLSGLQSPEKMPSWGKKLLTRRVNFIPTLADEGHVYGKINKQEAELVLEIIRFFDIAYSGQTLGIGVITPYRAQIATILYLMQQHNMERDNIQIDTVERFQGGAKDIIILSLCANYVHQLKTLVSLSSDGIDRKFNVAITRARNHLVVLGNPDVLVKDERYRAFMGAYRV
jgi:DNA replication ATP-dependent helicase Dna2